MTAITFQVRGYPAFAGETAKLFDGFADITLGERLKLPVQEPNRPLRQTAPPLQKALRWSIDRISIGGLGEECRLDAERFIRGRHWPQIDRLLYIAFLLEEGLPDHAAVYAQLCGRPN